jgi:ATP-dependent Lon protease
MGASFQGDPASALLEVLDPEQNSAFRDHYLDLPFDISHVFFVVTANTLDTIPPPLLDRMEIIQLPGYIDTEKLEIAKRYLVPKSLEKNGLKKNQVKYTKDGLLHIANAYAREAGVRNFEKNLDKIHRKLAKQIVEANEQLAMNNEQSGDAPKTGLAPDKANTAPKSDAAPDKAKAATQADIASDKAKTSPQADIAADKAKAAPQADAASDKVKTAPQAGVAPDKAKAAPQADAPPNGVFSIDKKLIEKHLGKPIFPEGDIKKADRPGMSVGLAWTNMGGDTLVIEATSIPGKEGLTLTGKMGDTMKESAAIAMTVARKLALERYHVAQDWFDFNHIHLHIPEGATPKDGPSAGITMATALLSLMREKVITANLVMTGELSLTGQVLPIGGLKEKTIAARRNKAKHIIIPKQNARDLDDIPDYVKKGIDFHPVERFDEVLALALPD